MIIEPVHQGEREHLLDLAVQTGLFTRDDAKGLLGNVLEEKSFSRAHSQSVMPQSHAGILKKHQPPAGLTSHQIHMLIKCGISGGSESPRSIKVAEQGRRSSRMLRVQQLKQVHGC